MLSVCLIWADAALTCYILGFFLLRRGLGLIPHRQTACLFAGLVLASVYAEIFSLFAGVGLTAILLFHLLCLAAALICRKSLLSQLRSAGRFLRADRRRTARLLLTGTLLILLFAAGSSAGNWHIDTPLYHAQSVHWIERYGVVPGLGNLQSHFAYNNACFSLYALFSFVWLTGQSFHAIPGFIALLVVSLCLFSPAENGEDASSHSLTRTAIRLASLLGIFFLFDELTSPSSDTCFLLLCSAVFLFWSELSARKEASALPYVCVCMLAIFTVTVKLAAAPLVLLCIKPLVMICREEKHDRRHLLRASVLGALAICLPFFVRGFILSGWLLYPVLPQHLIDLPWQIPDGAGIYEREEIAANGRMIFDASEIVASMSDAPLAYVIPWFRRQHRPAQLLLLVSLGALFLFLLQLCLFLLQTGRDIVSHKKTHLRRCVLTASGDALFMELVIAVCTVFWFFSTPQMRFGEGYLLLLCASVCGSVAEGLLRLLPAGSVSVLRKGVVPLPALFACLLLFITVRRGDLRLSHPLLQQDYDRYPTAVYSIGDFSFYYPTDFVYTGYYDFPATRWQATDVVPLGDDIRDGFGMR
ncbi:MAG: hypothetical protein K6G16_05075 [Lachnospiraceae bacterium]|nr:hypothetical protein [Lachnospiraceae bacterium]